CPIDRLLGNQKEISSRVDANCPDAVLQARRKLGLQTQRRYGTAAVETRKRRPVAEDDSPRGVRGKIFRLLRKTAHAASVDRSADERPAAGTREVSVALGDKGTRARIGRGPRCLVIDDAQSAGPGFEEAVMAQQQETVAIQNREMVRQ